MILCDFVFIICFVCKIFFDKLVIKLCEGIWWFDVNLIWVNIFFVFVKDIVFVFVKWWIICVICLYDFFVKFWWKYGNVLFVICNILWVWSVFVFFFWCKIVCIIESKIKFLKLFIRIIGIVIVFIMFILFFIINRIIIIFKEMIKIFKIVENLGVIVWLYFLKMYLIYFVIIFVKIDEIV